MRFLTPFFALALSGLVACAGNSVEQEEFPAPRAEDNVTSTEPVPSLGVYRLANGGDRAGSISLSAANGGSITFELAAQTSATPAARDNVDGRATRKADLPYFFQSKGGGSLSITFDFAAKRLTVLDNACGDKLSFAGDYVLAR